MAFIDAPEQKQTFGQKSKQFLDDKLYGKGIQLKRSGNIVMDKHWLGFDHNQKM